MVKQAQGTGRGAALQLEDVVFSYGESVFAFDLSIDPSDVVAVMGPSGSGKTTLLNLVAGFERPDGGRIFIDGLSANDVPPARRPVSMVFQENNLFAHIDLFDNVGLGLSPSLKLTAHDRDRIMAALAQTGLAGKEKRLPSELSGGERQRVALARVLLRDRPVLLLDEPFASLGPALRREMLDLVTKLHQERKMTVLMVSHQPEDAKQVAQKVVFLENGRIQASGDASIFFSGDAPQAFRTYLGE